MTEQFGTVIAYWLDYGTVKNLTGEVGLFFMLKKSSTDSIPKVVWRFPIAFQIVFALITLSTLPFLSDTPRWLYSQGRKEEAINVLARLMACDEDDQRVQMIQNEMREAINLESEKEKFDWKNLIYDRRSQKYEETDSLFYDPIHAAIHGDQRHRVLRYVS